MKQKRFSKQLRSWLQKNSMTWAEKDTDRADWHFRCQLQALLALEHDDKAPKGYEEFKIIMEKLIIDRDGDDEPDAPDDMPALIPNGQEPDTDDDMPPGPSPSRTAIAHSTASPASSGDADTDLDIFEAKLFACRPDPNRKSVMMSSGTHTHTSQIRPVRILSPRRRHRRRHVRGCTANPHA